MTLVRELLVRADVCLSVPSKASRSPPDYADLLLEVAELTGGAFAVDETPQVEETPVELVVDWRSRGADRSMRAQVLGRWWDFDALTTGLHTGADSSGRGLVDLELLPWEEGLDAADLDHRRSQASLASEGVEARPES